MQLNGDTETVRLTLPPLSRSELKFALAILSFEREIDRSERRQRTTRQPTSSRPALKLREKNPPTETTARRDAGLLKSAMKLEDEARAYAQRIVKSAKLKKQVWRYYFEEKPAEDVRIDTILRDWKEASTELRKAIEQRAGWFSVPYLALPAPRPIPAITSPGDLVLWFSVRLVANRQARFFVRCKLCDRFAVRRRSNAAYCDDRCQKLAKIEMTYKKRRADFSTWLLSQSKDRWLPPRMELQRVAAQRAFS